jgi:hypothetical protein
MDDPETENSQSGTGVTWRIRKFEDSRFEHSVSPIFIELMDAHGSTLATVSMPSETMEELLRPYFSIYAELQLDGSVSFDSEFFALSEPPTKTDVLDLVRQAVAPEMLEDEPEAAQMLSKFRDRLLKSLEHVEQAIVSLPKD